MRKTKSRERVRILSLVIVLLLLPTMMFAIPKSGKKVTLNLESVTVKEFFDALRQQTGLSFVYNTEQTKSLKPITIHVKDETVDSVLRTVLNGTGLTYSMERDIVTISKAEQQGDKRSATGIVSDEEGYPLPGVNVVISDLQRFAITDNNGKYSIEIPTNTTCTITFSYIGMSTQQVMINSGRNDVRKNITLKSDTKLDEVIVTGIYTRKAESFTGAATTISSKDLMRVGNQNVFQSLKNLDPTLYIADNFSMGSDPNTTPTMSMRGTSSFPTTETSSLKSNYQNQPNQPLFILDGFETTAETIMDMDMNRIESITILKDASAKALYGSKAANGVVVIETKKPERVRILWNRLFSSAGKILSEDFWRYTLPVLAASLVWGIAYVLYSVIMGHMGSDAVAANSITSIAKSLFSCLIRGVSGGAGVLIGNLLGANELEKAREYGGRLSHLSIAIGIVTGGLLMLISPAIVHFAPLSDTAAEYLQYMLLFCGLNLMAQSVNTTVLDGIFCAGGDAKFDMQGNIGAMWCFSVPLGFLAAFWLKLPVMVVYCIVNLDEIVKLPAVYHHYKKYIWVRNITRDVED